MVLETIFSYPTWAGVELLHKNTPIRERWPERRGREEEEEEEEEEKERSERSLNGS